MTPVLHLTIAIDLDGTIADFHGALIEKVGHPKDMTKWAFEEWYDDPKKVAAAKRFTKDPESYANLQPLPVAKKTIRALADAGHKLIAVTGRPKKAEEVTRTWLQRNFRGCFKEVYVVGPSQKVDTLASLAPHLIVDDNVKTVDALREKGMNAVIFNQPWNRGTNAPRVMGWTHFRKTIGA